MSRPTPLLAVVAAGLILSGCAESGGDSGSTGPVRVMVMQSMTGPAGVDQTAPDGATAAAERINASGGLDGRDIEVLECDTASDPNKATECAREAISENVVAVVGSFDPIGMTPALQVLQTAGIPYVSPVALAPLEYQADNSFPVTGGAAGGQLAMVPLAAEVGCTSLSTFGDEAADLGGFGPVIIAAWESEGIEVNAVDLPATTTDVTPAVSQALGTDPDCIAYAAQGNLAVQLFSAVRKAGSDAQFISATGALLPPYLEALGADAEGLVATQDTPALDSADLQPYRDDMAEYAADVQINPFNLSAWYGVKTLALAAEGVDELTAESVKGGLESLESVELPGLEPFSFAEPVDSETYPRMFNPTVQYTEVKSGRYVVTDETWHSVAEYLP